MSVVAATAAACSSSAIEPPTPTNSGISSSTVARRITSLTGGQGDVFCAAFGKAADVFALVSIASLGRPELSTQNELAASPGLVGPLEQMTSASPKETAVGVKKWTERTSKAIEALRSAGATNEDLARVAERLASLSSAEVARGSLAEQVGLRLDQARFEIASGEFSRKHAPSGAFADELNGLLGGELVGDAREQAVKQFPCLAGLDASEPAVS